MENFGSGEDWFPPGFNEETADPEQIALLANTARAIIEPLPASATQQSGIIIYEQLSDGSIGSEIMALLSFGRRYYTDEPDKNSTVFELFNKESAQPVVLFEFGPRGDLNERTFDPNTIKETTSLLDKLLDRSQSESVTNILNTCKTVMSLSDEDVCKFRDSATAIQIINQTKESLSPVTLKRELILESDEEKELAIIQHDFCLADKSPVDFEDIEDQPAITVEYQDSVRSKFYEFVLYQNGESFLRVCDPSEEFTDEGPEELDELYEQLSIAGFLEPSSEDVDFLTDILIPHVLVGRNESDSDDDLETLFRNS